MVIDEQRKWDYSDHNLMTIDLVSALHTEEENDQEQERYFRFKVEEVADWEPYQDTLGQWVPKSR